jgi:hypothetical protein
MVCASAARLPSTASNAIVLITFRMIDLPLLLSVHDANLDRVRYRAISACAKLIAVVGGL